MKKKITIRDVAYLSGVSISTVSRVVSGKMRVSEDTRKKVLRAIEKTGYEPDYTARALATNSTDTIAVIIDRSPMQSFSNAFFIEIIQSIVTQLTKYKKDMILLIKESEHNEEYNEVKRLIKSRKIDGVIKLSVQKDDMTLDYLISTNTPTVVVGRCDNSNIFTVNNDNKEAMRLSTKNLLETGCRKIAFVAGSPEYVVTIDRQQGFETALKENNIKIDKDDFYYIDFSTDSGYKLAKKLLDKKYDSIACTDDLIAFGISKYYNEHNKQIKINSFNNTYLSEISPIPFSSVDVNAKDLGKEAVELLFNNSNKIKDVIVDTNLILRS